MEYPSNDLNELNENSELESKAKMVCQMLGLSKESTEFVLNDPFTMQDIVNYPNHYNEQVIRTSKALFDTN